MSNILLEADAYTVDLRSITKHIKDKPESPKAKGTDSSEVNAKPVSSLTDDEIKNLLSNTFKMKPAIVQRIMDFGTPFKKAIRTLGTKIDEGIGANPLLAFVCQKYVQEQLIEPGLLNSSSFKAIYDAVSKDLVADSEFFVANNYNIIYCKNLYRKPAGEILKYLSLQSEILSPSAREYHAKDFINNKKVFLFIEELPTELNTKKRAEDVNNFLADSSAADILKKLPKISDAKLNSLELAEAIKSKAGSVHTVPLKDSDQDDIMQRLMDDRGQLDLAKTYALLLVLAVNSRNKRAKEILNRAKFSGLNPRQITDASINLAQYPILPNGQLKVQDINSLIDKIEAKL